NRTARSPTKTSRATTPAKANRRGRTTRPSVTESRCPTAGSARFRMIRTRVPTSPGYVIKTVAYTAFALTAFAFNSILCRMALLPGEADAAGFTALRLISGAVTLAAILFFVGRTNENRGRGNWFSAFFLFAYAICFSFAYLGLTTGTGALILFGSVQLTMIGVSILKGDRPGAMEWLGLSVAAAGLVYLVSPGIAAPPLGGALLMAAAG